MSGFFGGGGVSLSAANTWSAQNTFAAGTITTSQPLSVTQTWNAGGVTFNSLLVNVTDTASAAGSLLMDLQVGGVSKFSVKKDGTVTSANGTLLSAMTDTWNNAGTIFNAIKMDVTNTNSAANSALINLLVGGAPQLRFIKEKNLQIWNTGDDTNYERSFFKWESNALKIGTEAGGTGSTRNLFLQAQGKSFQITSSGFAFNSATTVTGGHFNVDAAFNMYWDTRIVMNSPAAGLWLVRAFDGTGAAVQTIKRTDPAAPSADNGYLYMRDNGGGKMQYVARFPTGAVQVIATEP